jgi:hypothetical protein
MLCSLLALDLEDWRSPLQRPTAHLPGFVADQLQGLGLKAQPKVDPFADFNWLAFVRD